MVRKVITHVRYPVLLAGIVLCLVGVAYAASGNIDPDNKWAWSTNAGWINFDPTHGGVTVYADHLEGYAWGENIGWIRLGSHTGGGAHHYDNTTKDNYGVNRNGSGNLSGYAWSTNVGWINFNPTHGGVTIDPATGSFDGYAWSENVGWIHFKNTGAAAYNVVAPPANLSLTKSVMPTTHVNLGQAITYTLTFYNAGLGTATDVVIADTIPVSVTNSSVISSGVAITQTSPGYVWSVQDLAPGQGGVITITGVLSDPLAGGTFTNTARIATTAVDANAGSNSDAAEVSVKYRICLPLVVNNYVVAPDLVVQSINVTASNVQVVIANQGNAPVSDDFWVDAYINPDPAPTAVNQIWNDLADEGLVWGVTAGALPLAPGDVLTLTVGDAYYVADYSLVTWPLAAGTPVYAQVDSAAVGTTYGVVLESHEIRGEAYNNVTGPVYSTAIGGEVGAPGVRRTLPVWYGDLPRRP